jgi:hypothetical protein
MIMLNLLIHSPLLALLLGPIVTYIGNRGQDLITAYDKLPPTGKQAAAVTLGFLFVGLSHLIPGVVPDACGNTIATGISSDCIAGLTSKDFITAVLTGLIAVAVKHGKQNAAK